MRALKSHNCTVGVKKNLCQEKKKKKKAEKMIKYSFLHLLSHVHLTLIFYRSAIVMHAIISNRFTFLSYITSKSNNFDLLN